VTVRTLLSTAGALSLINTQDASGATPLHLAAQSVHAGVTEQLIVRSGLTALQAAQHGGHAAIATLIRNTTKKCAKDVLLQAGPEKIKKKQKDADRANAGAFGGG
jgi:ankyrin repeat protein